MLQINNLVVQIEDKRILNGLDLTVNKGEVAAIMGPNGSGKSTLSYVIAGKEDYEVLDGEILLDGQNILEMGPDERAAAGLFLAFQYPLEIPGVASDDERARARKPAHPIPRVYKAACNLALRVNI